MVKVTVSTERPKVKDAKIRKKMPLQIVQFTTRKDQNFCQRSR